MDDDRNPRNGRQKNNNNNGNWRHRNQQDQGQNPGVNRAQGREQRQNPGMGRQAHGQRQNDRNPGMDGQARGQDQRHNNRKGRNDRSGPNDGNDRKEGGRQKGPYFHFTRLKELITKSDEDVMTTLREREEDFLQFISGIIRPDQFVLILRVLLKVCQVDYHELKTRILSKILSNNFVTALETYLTKLPMEGRSDVLNNRLYHEDKERFWNDLIEFFKKVNELFPGTVCNKLTPVLQKIIEKIFPAIELCQDYKIGDEIKDGFSNVLKDLHDKIEMMKQDETKINKRSTLMENIQERNPPEDFRMLSVIPTMDDLCDENPFLRECKVKDPYDSIETYLDVQFRLLREDFIRPLRSGIREYCKTGNDKKSRNSDFRIYNRANLIPFDNKENNVGIKLFFGKIKNINWQRAKRLMFGSLLLLSRDNFATVLFVTVSNRNEKELENGHVTIELCEGSNITPDMYPSTFVLLESKIYFEPYFQVLTAMKNIGLDNFPMEKYIVEAQTFTRLPEYLKHYPVLTFKNDILLPLNPHLRWPDANKLGMDESQFNAFKSAITEEFAVIQGPPGTGKTFLALEIVRTLLENKDHWIKYGPIVVVCLTNHALDQFLEGILNQQSTTSIVRVGARCKNETLKQYSIMERRKLYNNKISNSLLFKTKRELEDILEKLQKLRLFISYLKTPNIIVPLECLFRCRNEAPLNAFKSNTDLVNWLIDCDISPLLAKTATSNEQENVSEDIEEELFEEDEYKYTDDDLELDFKKLTIDSNGPVKLLKVLDEELQKVTKCLQGLRRKGFNRRNPGLDQIAIEAIENDQTFLITKRELVNEEFQHHHPIVSKHPVQSQNYRWQQYWHWVKLSHLYIADALFKLEADFRQKNAELNDVRLFANTEVMKKHEIIGLTTTCAAKIQSSLRALKAPIVLVEEAAEILEAHVVCSITRDCQHVILIGDHKQLRPKASVYELGTKYNLNISLFERMVNIRGQCTQLAHQHRMRPEISKLITPSIYETLHNHEVTLSYQNVKGLEKNVFFLDHTHREENYQNEESYKNVHEAKFFLAFAKHLLFQGYKPSEITILCTYTGQLFTLMNEVGRNSLLKQIRITTVDNYQGEENKIILLSLVRNNQEGNIGFLKEENRVCVALSRAKEGLYIMGNMDNLVHKNTIWPKIRRVLEEDGAIGDSLTLRCQLHHDQCTEVKSADDFDNSPEGGCLKNCGLLLSCGHNCKSVCHVWDRDHENHRCKENCVQYCPGAEKHQCPLKCYQGCQPCKVNVSRKLQCGHTISIPCWIDDTSKYPCPVQVEVTLPECNHVVLKPCHLSMDLCECTHDCEIRLQCGHACAGKCHARDDPDHLKYQCHKDCVKKNIDCEQNHICRKRCYEQCEPCAVLVDKDRSCGHRYLKIRCSVKVEEMICKKRCKRVMSCGHNCPLTCSEKCGNCPVKVKKLSSCGHEITVKCSEEATPAKCNGKCPKLLPCSHPCTKKCKDACSIKCEALVRLKEPGLCGHFISVPCYLRNTDPRSVALLKYCSEPCSEMLQCEHHCSGSCGQCHQGRIHTACKESCKAIFICGHKCEIACNKECLPCTKKCELACQHSKCMKKCGESCALCQERCDYGCEHQRCTKRCYELCDIEPCLRPCPKMLKCGHPCVSFCGDLCPSLCRICDKDELTETFFGTEDEEDARFVLLPDCNHCMENEGLLQWIAVSTQPDESKEIKTPTCPRCKTPIKSCMRIMNDIKRNLLDLAAIKEKNFSNNRADLEGIQKEYVRKIDEVMVKPVLSDFKTLKSYIQTVYNLGNVTKGKRKQTLSHIEVNVFKNVLDIIVEMVSVLEKLKIKPGATHEFIRKHVDFLAESLPDKLQMSKQRLDDLQLEMRRLHFMVQVYNNFSQSGIVLTNEQEYKILIDHENSRLLMKKLCGLQKFTANVEKDITSLCNSISKISIKVERDMIVKAMGLTPGHWFKCPNGHFYAIGECGGAMQRGRCVECKAVIGGENHRLVGSNALASEMDGAERAAWPGGLY